MRIAIIVLGGVATILGVLLGLQFADLDRQRWPKLAWLDRNRLPLAGITILCLAASILLTMFDVKAEQHTQLTPGPNNQISPKASIDAIDQEIDEASRASAAAAKQFYRSGDAFLHLQRFAPAADAYRQSVKLVPTKPALVNLAIALRYLSDPAGSINAAKRALALPVKTTVSKSLDATALLQIGAALATLGKRDQAWGHLNEALARFTEVDDLVGKAATEYQMGAYQHRAGNTQQALQLMTAARTYFVDAHDSLGEASALNGLGVVALDQGRTTNGIDHLSRALALFRSIGESTGEAGVLMNLGTAHQDMCDMPNALREYSEAAVVATRVGNRSLAALATANAANAYVEMGEPVRALEKARSAIQICKTITAPETDGWAHLYAAAAEILNDNLPDAKRDIAVARDNLTQTNKMGLLAVSVQEARIAIAERQFAIATKTLDAALQDASAAEYHTARIEILVAEADVSLEQHDQVGARRALIAADEICRASSIADCDCVSIREKMKQKGSSLTLHQGGRDMPGKRVATSAPSR